MRFRTIEFRSRDEWIGSGQLFKDGFKIESGDETRVYVADGDIRASYRLPDEFSDFQTEIVAIWGSIG